MLYIINTTWAVGWLMGGVGITTCLWSLLAVDEYSWKELELGLWLDYKTSLKQLIINSYILILSFFAINFHVEPIQLASDLNGLIIY